MLKSRPTVFPSTGHYLRQDLVLLGHVGLNSVDYFMHLSFNSGKIHRNTNLNLKNKACILPWASVDLSLAGCADLHWSEALNYHCCHAKQTAALLPKQGLTQMYLIPVLTQGWPYPTPPFYLHKSDSNYHHVTSSKSVLHKILLKNRS